MRVRTHEGRILPAGIHFKHGSYYRVYKNVWQRLGRTLDEAIAALPNMAPPLRLQDDVRAFALRKFASVRQNARTRGIPFELARSDLEKMLREANGRCTVTGVRFSLVEISGQRPYAPSIDRREAKGGYTADNCRLVCVAANLAMNVWGESVLKAMTRRVRVLDVK